MKIFFKIPPILLLIFCALPSWAQYTYTSKQDGSYNSPSTWNTDDPSPDYPGANDEVVIHNTVKMLVSGNAKKITVTSGGAFNISSSTSTSFFIKGGGLQIEEGGKVSLESYTWFSIRGKSNIAGLLTDLPIVGASVNFGGDLTVTKTGEIKTQQSIFFFGDNGQNIDGNMTVTNNGVFDALSNTSYPLATTNFQNDDYSITFINNNTVNPIRFRAYGSEIRGNTNVIFEKGKFDIDLDIKMQDKAKMTIEKGAEVDVFSVFDNNAGSTIQNKGKLTLSGIKATKVTNFNNADSSTLTYDTDYRTPGISPPIKVYATDCYNLNFGGDTDYELQNPLTIRNKLFGGAWATHFDLNGQTLIFEGKEGELRGKTQGIKTLIINVDDAVTISGRTKAKILNFIKGKVILKKILDIDEVNGADEDKYIINKSTYWVSKLHSPGLEFYPLGTPDQYLPVGITNPKNAKISVEPSSTPSYPLYNIENELVTDIHFYVDDPQYSLQVFDGSNWRLVTLQSMGIDDNGVYISAPAQDVSTNKQYRLVGLKADGSTFKPFKTVWKGITNLPIKTDNSFVYSYTASLVGEDITGTQPPTVQKIPLTTGAHTFTGLNANLVYTLRIYGDFPHFKVPAGSESKFLGILSWGEIKWKSFEESFEGCQNIIAFPYQDEDVPDLSETRSMFRMFSNCDIQPLNDDLTAIREWGISDWNVKKVQNMQEMFLDNETFNKDITGWNVEGATNMKGMFKGAKAFNQDLSSWKVKNVKDMSEMFKDAIAFNNGDSGDNAANKLEWGAKTGLVENMASMFDGAIAFNQDISSWDVSSVAGTGNILNFDGMNTMFSGATVFNNGGKVLEWGVKTKNVTNMNAMFLGAKAFNQDISGWDVSNVKVMVAIFSGATAFNQDIGTWQLHPDVVRNNMLDDCGMDTEHYDATLLGWASQVRAGLTLTNPVIGVKGLTYCMSEDEVKYLEGGWTFEGTHSKATDCKLKEPFVTMWSIPTGVDKITIAVDPNQTYDYRVKIIKDDGTYHKVYPLTSTKTVLDIPAAGDYTISIYGTFPHFQIQPGVEEYLTAVTSWGEGTWASFANAFKGCTNLSSVPTVSPIMNDNISMASMFEGCTALDQSLNGWDMSKVSDLSSIFKNASKFNNGGKPLKWNFQADVDLAHMLDNCGFTPANYDATIIDWKTNNNIEIDGNFGAKGLRYCASKEAKEFLTNNKGWVFVGDIASCPFESVWRFNAGEKISLGHNSLFTYNYTINIYQVVAGAHTLVHTEQVNNTNFEYTFVNTGDYIVSISGAFPHLMIISDPSQLQEVTSWGDVQWKSFESAFTGCTQLTKVPNVTPLISHDISQISMKGMFKGCKEFNADITQWDVSKVNNMIEMFAGTEKFDQDLSNWNVSQVTNMYAMFKGATGFNNNSIGNWTLNAGVDLSEMLDNCGMTQKTYEATLEGWSEKNLIRTVSLGATGLTYCERTYRQKLLDNGWSIINDQAACAFISTWKPKDGKINVYAATGLTYNYNYSIRPKDGSGTPITGNNITGNLDISGLSTGVEYTLEIQGQFPKIFLSNPTNRDGAGELQPTDNEAGELIGVERWGDVGWTSLDEAFVGASSLVSAPNTLPQQPDQSLPSLITTLNKTFKGCSSFNSANVKGWVVSNVTQMNGTFDGATSFDQNLSGWDINKVTQMSYMFANATAFDNGGNALWPSKSPALTDISFIFYKAKSFNRSVSSLNVSAVSNFESVFDQASSFKQSLASWDVSIANNMLKMLNDCGMSVDNYDETIMAWSSKLPTTGFEIGVKGLKYCKAENKIITLTGKGYSFTDHSKDTNCDFKMEIEVVEGTVIEADPNGTKPTTTVPVTIKKGGDVYTIDPSHTTTYEVIEVSPDLGLAIGDITFNASGLTFTKPLKKAGEHWVKVKITENGVVNIVTIPITVEKASQNIVFDPTFQLKVRPDLGENIYEVIGVVASSGLPITYLLEEDEQVIKRVNDNTFEIIENTEGKVLLYAFQEGNEDYKPSEKAFLAEIHTYTEQPNALKDNLSNLTKIYPNPLPQQYQGKVVVELPKQVRPNKCFLVDPQGKRISIFLEREAANYHFDTPLAAGMHILIIHTDKGVITKKLIIQ